MEGSPSGTGSPPAGRFDGPALAAAILLLLGTAYVYGATGGNGFVPYDDQSYVYRNPHVLRGLTAEGLRWAFTTFHHANWHPLAWLSHMADVELFGLDAGAHHLVSAALHGLSSLLLFLALRSMTGLPWRSLLVALLFALHPLHVEPVAWAAERKEVLCALFFHGALLAYGAYAARGGARRYGAVLLLFALALLSKPMAVTLPFVLLLLDWWPLGRLRLPGEEGGVPLAALLREKVPLLLLSAASCAVTLAAQASGRAIQGAIPLGERLRNAAEAYAAYLGKALWPAGLSPFYPHPFLAGGEASPAWFLPALLLAAATGAALLLGRRARWLPAGWFWYLGTLVPVIGLVQVGSQAMADRYAYLPLTGIFLAAAWAVPAPRAGWDRRTLAAGAAAAALLLVPLAEAARRQALVWKDGETLFRHAAAATRGNWVALSGLGAALTEAGRPAEALPYLEEAVRANPDHLPGWLNLGDALLRLGRPADALAAFERGVAADPRNEAARGKAGVALFALGRGPEAVARFRESVALDPAYADGWYNLGVALLEGGLPAEAEGAFRQLLDLRPGHPDVLNRLGTSLARQGRAAEAEEAFRAVLRAFPGNREAAEGLGRLPGGGRP